MHLMNAPAWVRVRAQIRYIINPDILPQIRPVQAVVQPPGASVQVAGHIISVSSATPAVGL
jgi:hypothetical protein